VRESQAQLVKKDYLPDWMSFAPAELDSLVLGEVRSTNNWMVGFGRPKAGMRLHHIWNLEVRINKHFLTCDEKCRIKGEISSPGNPAGTCPIHILSVLGFGSQSRNFFN
jgi:hypothetical protein